MILICKYCNRSFKANRCRRKFCSHFCFLKSDNNKKFGDKNPTKREKVKKKMSKSAIGKHLGENNGHWSGDKIKYNGLHSWVRRIMGCPKMCEICGDITKDRYEWANKNHLYKRDKNDWIRLCTSCHRYMDGNSKKIAKKAWVTRKVRYGMYGHT